MNSKNEPASEKIAVIRVRGNIRVGQDNKDTLSMLRLYKKNYCVVLNGTASINGMIKKVKDYVTWGEIDDETFDLLKEKRGKTKANGEMKPFFRLSPPRGGFERKGIKTAFTLGGALGYRESKINDLIKRMV